MIRLNWKNYDKQRSHRYILDGEREETRHYWWSKFENDRLERTLPADVGQPGVKMRLTVMRRRRIIVQWPRNIWFVWNRIPSVHRQRCWNCRRSCSVNVVVALTVHRVRRATVPKVDLAVDRLYESKGRTKKNNVWWSVEFRVRNRKRNLHL